MNKELRRLARHLQPQGLVMERTRSGHYVVRDGAGYRVTTMASTPSDRRGWQNALAYIRRAGYTTPS